MKHDEKKNNEVEKKNETLKADQVKVLQIIEELFRRLQICEQKNHQNKQHDNFNLSKLDIDIEFTFLSQFSRSSNKFLEPFFVAKFSHQMYKINNVKTLFMKLIYQDRMKIT